MFSKAGLEILDVVCFGRKATAQELAVETGTVGGKSTASLTIYSKQV